MLASSRTISAADSLQGGQISLETVGEEGIADKNQEQKDVPSDARNSSLGEFYKLQVGSIFSTLVLSVLAGAIAAIFFDFHTASSLFVGGLSGALYLWLLARSVEKLGKDSRNLSKTQLLVPVVLCVAASRLSYLDLLPAIIGFFLYKPAVLLRFVLSN